MGYVGKREEGRFCGSLEKGFRRLIWWRGVRLLHSEAEYLRSL